MILKTYNGFYNSSEKIFIKRCSHNALWIKFIYQNVKSNNAPRIRLFIRMLTRKCIFVIFISIFITNVWTYCSFLERSILQSYFNTKKISVLINKIKFNPWFILVKGYLACLPWALEYCSSSSFAVSLTEGVDVGLHLPDGESWSEEQKRRGQI